MNPSLDRGAPSFSHFQTCGDTEKQTEGSPPATILLVEDNPADVLLIREALEEHSIRADIYVLSDGEKAVRFVENESRELAPPDLVILDLNLPRKTGREVLHENIARRERWLAEAIEQSLTKEERALLFKAGELLDRVAAYPRLGPSTA